jgi:hypothetical protein
MFSDWPLYLQKTAKRKKIHAFKSKARFEQLEFAQNKRQNAWQQFQTTKGKAKKVLFLFVPATRTPSGITLEASESTSSSFKTFLL